MKSQLLNSGVCYGRQRLLRWTSLQTAQADLAHSVAACSTIALFWSGRDGLASQILMGERKEGIKRQERKEGGCSLITYAGENEQDNPDHLS